MVVAIAAQSRRIHGPKYTNNYVGGIPCHRAKNNCNKNRFCRAEGEESRGASHVRANSESRREISST